MSSFICSPKHFASIRKTVTELAQNRRFYFPYSFKEKFPVLHGNKNFTDDTIEKTVFNIVESLIELNVICVSLQYKHHYEGRLNAEIAEQMEIAKAPEQGENLSLVELFKALQCVNYQIELCHLKELRDLTQAEEDAMFFVDEMKSALAEDIVNQLPNYEKAKWEIV